MDLQAYNKGVKPGHQTLIGNWQEERALLEATGQARKEPNGRKTLKRTGQRLVYHSANRNDWTSQARATHINNSRHPHPDIKPKAEPLPSRSAARHLSHVDTAKKIVADAELEMKLAREADVNAARFGHKAPFNRTRVLQTSNQTKPAYSLNGPAITLYNRNHSAHHGVTPCTGAQPFGRSTNFSKPLAEYTEKAFR